MANLYVKEFESDWIDMEIYIDMIEEMECCQSAILNGLSNRGYGYPRNNFQEYTCGMIADVIDNLENCLDDVLEMMSGEFYGTVTETVTQYFKPTYKDKWNTRDIHEWKKLAEHYNDYGLGDNEYLMVIEMITGKKYDFHRITGCCQGEVMYVVYPENVSDELINAWEGYYWGLGMEVHAYEVDERLLLDEFDDIEDVMEVNNHLIEDMGWTFIPNGYSAKDVINWFGLGKSDYWKIRIELRNEEPTEMYHLDLVKTA